MRSKTRRLAIRITTTITTGSCGSHASGRVTSSPRFLSNPQHPALRGGVNDAMALYVTGLALGNAVNRWCAQYPKTVRGAFRVREEEPLHVRSHTLRDAKMMAEALDEVWSGLDRVVLDARRRVLLGVKHGRFSAAGLLHRGR
jgi:hypothetical protein